MQKKTSEQIINIHFDKTISAIDSLIISTRNNFATNRHQGYFLKARREYKHIEMVVEYVYPFFAKFYINGPPIKKHDIENGNKVFEPHGFQILEPGLFTSDTSLSKEESVYEMKLLKESFVQVRKKFNTVTPSKEQYFDMMQLELIRLITLDINGYDCSITKQNIKESVYVLEGISELLRSIISSSINTKSIAGYKELIKRSENYLLSQPDYNKFNRLEFITDHIKPLYFKVCEIRKSMNVPQLPIKYAVNFDEKVLFGEQFFNRDYFSVNIYDAANRKKQIELGKNLFFDPVLSGNNKRACASCHKPEFGFADTVAVNFEYDKRSNLKRNTPSLLNVMYQKNFFYDGRALQMEDQVSDVLHAKKEMNAIPSEIVSKLKQSSEYRELFRNAFKGSEDTSITFYAVLKSISEFEKELISMNSRFDQYLHGNKKALNKNEINGYNLFSGKALCGSCHFFPFFNGLVPPVYADNEFEVIGTTTGPLTKILDTDSGRFLITKKSIHLYSFKTPGVRNVEHSAPYMHNGNFRTLDQVIDFYNMGGGSVATEKLAHQTLPFDSLQLSVKERSDIKAFLFSLTDNSHAKIKPQKLPLFMDSELSKRRVGGEY